MLKRLSMPYPLLSIAISIGVAISAGTCAYLFIELPVTRRRKRIIRNRGFYEPSPKNSGGLPQPAGGKY